jgi:hypothetical protein
VNGGSVEIGHRGDAAPIQKREIVCECFNGAGNPIAARAAQFHQIVRRWKGHDKAAAGTQNTPEFARIHPRGDRQDDGERAVGVWQEAIGIGDDPFAFRITPRRGINSRRRDVDAMRIEACQACKAAEVESVTAARIENDIARRCGNDLGDRVEQRLGHTTIMESPPCCRGSLGVAWILGSPLLWLEQVDVSATRDVKGMPPWTKQSPLLARKGHVAAAYGAKEHASSVVEWPLGENGSMRKRITGSGGTAARPGPGVRWMDLAEIATVEVTSEDPDFPIESVFSANGGPGWRASQKGEQKIRLIFDQALKVHRIQLHFLEPSRDRLQEFTVRWLAADGGQPKEIVRQQWNFSPAGSTSELEDYEVNLDGVSALELVIRPDLTHNDALATLAAWRVA